MKPLLRVIILLVLSMSSLISKIAENESAQKAIDASKKLLVFGGDNLADFREPSIWDKNDPKNPVKTWAKDYFNKASLAKIDKLEYFTIVYLPASPPPRPGGVMLFVYEKKDTKLIYRAGQK